MLSNSRTCNPLLALSLIYVYFLAVISCEADYTRGARVISKEEMAKHNGKDSPELWLSILGEVYDVTKGAEYYGEGAPYRVFVGRDGSAAFVTGNFTPEAAELAVMDVLNDSQLHQLNTWKDFYVKEEKYPFVGVLEGAFYDKEGNPTAELERVRNAAAVGKAALDEKKRKIQERVDAAKKTRAEKDEAERKKTMIKPEVEEKKKTSKAEEL